MANGKMKIFSVVLFLVLGSYCSSQIIKKQVRIPINNSTGVPYMVPGEARWDYYIQGFDVDSVGNYYFLAGDHRIGITVLAAFNGSKEKYRKTYDHSFANTILIHNNKIYVLDKDGFAYENHIVYANDLYELSTYDGRILKKYVHITKKFINDYEYVDNLIVADVADSMRFPLGARHYELFDLKGEDMGSVKNEMNIYNLPDSLKLPKKKTRIFLGRWNKCNVFWGLQTNDKPGNLGVGYYNFYFYDSIGKYIGMVSLDNKVFGMQFFMFPHEHKRMRNGTIYILGWDDKDALISELSVEELYKDALQHPIIDKK